MKKKITAQELAKDFSMPLIRCLFCGIDISDKEVRKPNSTLDTFYVLCCKENEFVYTTKGKAAFQSIDLNNNGEDICYYYQANTTELYEYSSNITLNSNQQKSLELIELNGFFPYKKFIKTKNFI